MRQPIIVLSQIPKQTKTISRNDQGKSFTVAKDAK